MIETTLRELRKLGACEARYKHLRRILGRKHLLDTPLTLLHILECNGPTDTLWALVRLGHMDIARPLLADIAERTLPRFQAKYPQDLRPRQAVEGIRAFHRGEITVEELRALADAADAAAYYAASAADTADAASAAYYAASAAYAVSAADTAYAADAAVGDGVYACPDREAEVAWQTKRIREALTVG